MKLLYTLEFHDIVVAMLGNNIKIQTSEPNMAIVFTPEALDELIKDYRKLKPLPESEANEPNRYKRLENHIKEYRAAMQWYCDTRDAGETATNRGYTKFKELLDKGVSFGDDEMKVTLSEMPEINALQGGPIKTDGRTLTSVGWLIKALENVGYNFSNYEHIISQAKVINAKEMRDMVVWMDDSSRNAEQIEKQFSIEYKEKYGDR
jgi:hypothetical protein